ncbi:hypothetical protein CONLIGDRAFT_300560 [Coniochaeta ligniaria NRRL 30616]|uniref:Uncharacterized protein n=1 Tax=Coniochaeta ligniaria NRRL 30616 TaxID=1408157 RepID=A0A1J7JP63_9PEZI|nr:hypothetical protein CONLIGDRAFT_300560 [Coniochaeta ligniaria NRRL 30616]
MSSYGKLGLEENSTYICLSENGGGFEYALFTTTTEPNKIMWYYDLAWDRDETFAAIFREMKLADHGDMQNWAPYVKVADADHRRVKRACEEESLSRAETDDCLRLESNEYNQTTCRETFIVLKHLQENGVVLSDININTLLSNARLMTERNLKKKTQKESSRNPSSTPQAKSPRREALTEASTTERGSDRATPTRKEVGLVSSIMRRGRGWIKSRPKEAPAEASTARPRETCPPPPWQSDDSMTCVEEALNHVHIRPRSEPRRDYERQADDPPPPWIEECPPDVHTRSRSVLRRDHEPDSQHRPEYYGMRDTGYEEPHHDMSGPTGSSSYERMMERVDAEWEAAKAEHAQHVRQQRRYHECDSGSYIVRPRTPPS